MAEDALGIDLALVEFFQPPGAGLPAGGAFGPRRASPLRCGLRCLGQELLHPCRGLTLLLARWRLPRRLRRRLLLPLSRDCRLASRRLRRLARAFGPPLPPPVITAPPGALLPRLLALPTLGGFLLRLILLPPALLPLLP